jgi:CheY-like chemotaxis protein
MSERILIADDEPNILISLEYLMKRAGYEVSIARDGQEAIDAIRRERVALVEGGPDAIAALQSAGFGPVDYVQAHDGQTMERLGPEAVPPGARLFVAAWLGKTRLIDMLPDTLADAWSGKKSFNRVLGKQLAKKNGRIMPNGLIIKKKGIEHQAVNWCVSAKPEKSVNVKLGSLGSQGSLQQPIEASNKKIFPCVPAEMNSPNYPNSHKSDQEVPK